LPPSQFANAKTIVDLGAHIGMTAAFFQIHCPQAKIYCVEADESNYALLTNNLQPAINSRSVIAMHAAISNRNNTVYLQKAAHSFNSQIVDNMTGFPVKGIRLEQFLREQQITHIDIIKIDIEGAEAVLLNDDTSWLAITDTILIEIHSEENLQLFTAAVAQHGFRIEKMELENESLYLASKIRHK
jgi:FkbM family methyltransferase